MIRTSELVLNFLINATWQIAAIVLVATVCARLLNNAPARYRHLLWVAALLLSVALPIWSVSRIKTDAPDQPAERIATQTRVRDVSDAAPFKQTTNPQLITTAPDRPASSNRLFQTRSQQFSAGPTVLLVLSLIYGLFLLYRLGRLWRCWQRTAALKRSLYYREVPAQMRVVAAQCRSALRLQSVPMACSRMTSAPGVVGGRKPVIVLPEDFFNELPEETLCSILGHEMAHVSRHDFQLNLVYEFLFLPISFHPLARVIKQQIERSRELACDEMVTETLLEPVAHARSLVRIAGALITPSDQALTLGIFDANILEERIMKLTRTTRRLGLRAGRLLTLTAVALLCFSCLAISTFSVELRTEQGRSTGTRMLGNETTPTGSDRFVTNETRESGQNQGRSTPETARVESERMKSADAQGRAQAACNAGRSGALEALPELISMLGDDTKTELIRCWTNGRWTPALSTFKHPSPGEQAAIALASMGSPAFESLANALSHSSATVRRNAAWAIGELTNMARGERTEAVMPLISLLSDSDAWVRMAAARALGELRDERAGERLVASLLDSDPGVRQTGAWALGEMKDERAVQTLCNVLVSDMEIGVRLAAAEALGEIRNLKAVPSLTQALNDSEPRVRAKAKWAIAEIEDSDG